MFKKFKIPKTNGARADLLYLLRHEKMIAQATVNAIDQRMGVIEQLLIDTLPADDAEGVVGLVAKAVIITKVIPTVEPDGWPKVWEYVRKHDAFDLLQRRLNGAAVKARWEEKKAIPGVTKFVSKDISLTKR